MTPRPKTRIDWGVALAAYVAAGPEHRSYGAVAKEWRLSETTVRKHAAGGKCRCCPLAGWDAIAGEIDRKAASQALTKAAKTRTERAMQALRIADGYLDGIEANLEAKVAESKLSDMPAIVKLAELLEGEATERIDPGQVQQVLALVLRIGAKGLPREEFLAEFDRAVAGILEAGPAELEEG